MHYCLRCSHKLELKIPDDDNRNRLVCPNCSYIHYENPKVIVGVLPFYQDKILLCQRSIEPGYGLWTIPSVFMECNETLQEGAKREAQEEVGIECDNLQLFVVYSIPRISQVYMLFCSELASNNIGVGPETLAADFFSFNTIPWSDIAFSAVKFSLNKFVSNYPITNNEFFIN